MEDMDTNKLVIRVPKADIIGYSGIESSSKLVRYVSMWGTAIRSNKYICIYRKKDNSEPTYDIVIKGTYDMLHSLSTGAYVPPVEIEDYLLDVPKLYSYAYNECMTKLPIEEIFNSFIYVSSNSTKKRSIDAEYIKNDPYSKCLYKVSGGDIYSIPIVFIDTTDPERLLVYGTMYAEISSIGELYLYKHLDICNWDIRSIFSSMSSSYTKNYVIPLTMRVTPEKWTTYKNCVVVPASEYDYNIAKGANLLQSLCTYEPKTTTDTSSTKINIL